MRSSSRPRGFRVPQAAGRQPGRDRDPGLPRRLRARPGDGRGVPLRGPQLPAPREGRRVVPDRRARPPGARLPVGRRGDRARRGGRARTRSTPATASCRRTPSSPRRAPTPGSPSSGRPPSVLHLTGNKARAVAAAREAGVPVLGSSAPSADVDALVAAADGVGFPLFVKAVAGGGGRGMRRVDEPGELRESARRPRCARPSPRSATRRCSWSRPSSTRGTSRCRSSPTPTGNVVHLYERDCSLQRRHQKVIEIAPAPNLDPQIRDRICADAVAFARAHRLRQRRHGRVPARRARRARASSR